MRQMAKDFLDNKYGAENVKMLGGGSDSVAFRVNDQVFRFTRKDKHIYQREAAICHFLQPYISLEIPDIHVVDDGDLFYAVHKMLTGESWSWHKFSFHPRLQRNLAKSCARFLADLHGVDTKKAKQVVPDIDSGLPYVDMDEVRPFFQKYMGRRLLAFFERHYMRIISQPVADKDMVIVHMGLKGANSVCQPDGNLKSVFDFGNCGIYERSRDLVLFSLSRNRRLYSDVLKYYREMTGADVTKKRIMDLATIEFMWKKRWLINGEVKQLISSHFMRKQIATAVVHFAGLPQLGFRWMLMMWMALNERRNAR